MVTYADFELNFLNQLPEKALFEIFKPSVVGKDKLLSEIEININGYRGRELNMIRPDGRLRLSRFYVVGPRVYELDVTLKKDEKSSQKADIFFDSFKLNSQKDH